MKFIIVILMLSGCVTAPQDSNLTETLNSLQDQLYRHSFLVNMNTCFIGYNKCMIHTKDKTQCWKSHEKCVIDTSRMNKIIRETALKRRNKGE